MSLFLISCYGGALQQVCGEGLGGVRPRVGWGDAVVGWGVHNETVEALRI